MFRCILLIVTVVVSPGTLHAVTLTPAGAERFFVAPGKSTALQWHVESGTIEGPIQAVVHDYQDRPVATLPAKVTAEGLVELTVELAAGFYDIELPAAEQRFGVMALAAHEGPKDPFFSIDAAMSWLVHGDEVRESLVKVLERSGVAMSRERLNWAEISPARGTWDWDSPRHYETLRRSYAEHGVDVLEMFHGTTRWAGHVVKYPDDLVGTAQAWREIALRWRSTWDAMEVWNEPDIFFGGNLPADQYVPLVKTFAYVFAREQINLPIVGGVFAHYNRKFLDNAARNGLLDSIDVASFHTYGRAPGMETLIENYRSWLAAHGHEAMPLWLTECGRPWKRGPDRPPADQDAESALDITMKAVESRACGIARYFAFVYPFYEERDNNFGMMGRRATPLRSMSAYARLASLLAHKRYLGDLSSDDATLQRARVFGDDRAAVAVLYTGRPNPDARLKLHLPVDRIEGIDGRVLEMTEEGSVPVPDGLVYVWLDPAQLGDRLLTDTPAMRMSSIEPETAQRRQTASPIVLRYQFDAEAVEATSEGYRVKSQPPGKMPVRVRVFNLSTEPRDLKLALRLRSKDPDSTSSTILPDKRPLSAPAEGFVDLAWEIDLDDAFAASGHVEAEVLATDDEAGRNVASLVIDLSGEATLEQVLKRYPGHVRLPIDDLSAWTANIVGHGRMTMDAAPDKAWRLAARFGEGDRWVYPFFKLSDDVDVSRFAALVLRARSHQPATVRVFLWEGDQSVGYMTAGSVIAADGEWHTAIVAFGDLVPCGATSPDLNHQLDLPLVQRISIGFNTEAGENTLELSDVYVVGNGG